MTALSEAPARQTREHGWAPLVVVLVGTFMTFLDFFIVNVALPSIQTGLSAGPDAVQLVIAGYGLTFAVGMISGGRLGDLYGRRRMFTVGLALFTLTSALCGLAPGAGALVAARVAQGAAGAMLTPQVLAILGTVYTGRRRATAFSAYGMAMGIAGVLGQLFGGALIDLDPAGLGWRSIFLINVPVGLLALLAVRRSVPESAGPRAPLDLVGTALVTAGLVALVLPLVEGQQHGWPVWTWVSLGCAPVVLSAFVVQQRVRGGASLVDLSLFLVPAFARGLAVALVFGLVPQAFFFALALYLQDGRGLSPLASGAVFAAVGVGYFAALLVAPALGRRLGRQVLSAGAGLVAAGCLLLAGAAHQPAGWVLLPGLAVVGAGIGLVLVPLSSIVLADVPPHLSGAAAGVLATGQQVGGAVGVALGGLVFYRALGSVATAFTATVLVVAALTVLTLGLVQLLPGVGGR